VACITAMATQEKKSRTVTNEEHVHTAHVIVYYILMFIAPLFSFKIFNGSSRITTVVWLLSIISS
jgi:hypothetical protein